MKNVRSAQDGPDQIYNQEELKLLLTIEAQRPILESKRFNKLVDYSLIQDWAKTVGLNSNPFSETLPLSEMMASFSPFCQQLTLLSLQQSSDKDLINILQKVTAYLKVEKPATKTDLIFVFTSKSLTRIQKAVELYHQGVSLKMVIAGNHPIYKPNEAIESHLYRDWAISHGVPESSIMLIDDTISIADSIRRSLNLFDQTGLKFNRFLFVTAWFNLKRAFVILEKHLTSDQESFFVSADIDPSSDVSPQRWSQNEFGLKIIINEFLKMKLHDFLIYNHTL